MKAFPWLLSTLLAVILLLVMRTPQPIAAPVTTTVVRDSARTVAVRESVVVVKQVQWLRSAQADTLARLLRERAQRPAVLAGDTVYVTGADTTGDSACVSREDLAGAAAHASVDSAQRILDQWQIRIERARADSIAAHLGVCLASQGSTTAAYGRGFLHGAATGAGICIATKSVLSFF